MNKNDLEETKKSKQLEATKSSDTYSNTVTNNSTNDVLNGVLTNMDRNTSDAVSEGTIKLKAFLANTKRF